MWYFPIPLQHNKIMYVLMYQNNAVHNAVLPQHKTTVSTMEVLAIPMVTTKAIKNEEVGKNLIKLAVQVNESRPWETL